MSGVLINNVPPFCQYLTNKVESSIYLYDTYDLEIVNIIKDFENGKASDIPTILIKNQLKLFRHYELNYTIILWMQEYFRKFLKLVKSLQFIRKEIKNSWRTTG